MSAFPRASPRPEQRDRDHDRAESRTRSPRASYTETRSPLASPRLHPSSPRNISTPRIDTTAASRPGTALASPHNKSPHLSTPLRRCSSSLSTSPRRASSPTLLRKASMNSLRSAPASPHLSTRRSSSSLLNGGLPAVEEPLTGTSVAREYFSSVLQPPIADPSNLPKDETEVVVILNDACYDHRYARPKTSKATLSMIVERPERLRAVAAGVAAAYVLLGGHHADGSRPPRLNTRAAGPFAIRRTERSLSLTDPVVEAVHGAGWMAELAGLCSSAETRLASGGRELERAPGAPKLHSGDLYLCGKSRGAFEGALGAVADAVDAVFTEGRVRKAFVAARPPGHHCGVDEPSGFCWVNNVCVGVEYAARKWGATAAAILDFDLHHGDGSQTVAWGRNERANASGGKKKGPQVAPVGYFSLHDINSYPCEMGDADKVRAASLCIANAHGQSVWNVHLQPWTQEADFWQLYEGRYTALLDQARAFLHHQAQRARALGVQPRTLLFLSAGFDASEHEGAGMQRHAVNVPSGFYARFTADVGRLADEEGLGVGGRVVSVLEGGYSDEALVSGTLAHIAGLVSGGGGLIKEEDEEEASRLGALVAGLSITTPTPSPASTTPYNPTWTSHPQLSTLVSLLHPPSPAVTGPTKKRSTAFSPTASSTLKQIDPSSLRRPSPHRSSSRPPSPPPPRVEWHEAVGAVLEHLVPRSGGRSYEAAELAVAKHPPMPAPPRETNPGGRTLRTRAPKVASPPPPVARGRAAAGADRRRTIAAVPSDAPAPVPAAKGRRLSIASIGSTASTAATPVSGVRGKKPTPPATAGAAKKPAPRVSAGRAVSASVPGSRGGSVAPVTAAVRPSTSGTGAAGKVNGKAGEGETVVKGEGGAGGVDDLTAGIKRIKIRVPTDEEYAARLAAKKGTTKASTTKPAAKPAAKTAAKPAAKKPVAKAAVKSEVSVPVPALVKAEAEAQPGAGSGMPAPSHPVVAIKAEPSPDPPAYRPAAQAYPPPQPVQQAYPPLQPAPQAYPPLQPAPQAYTHPAFGQPAFQPQAPQVHGGYPQFHHPQPYHGHQPPPAQVQAQPQALAGIEAAAQGYPALQPHMQLHPQPQSQPQQQTGQPLNWAPVNEGVPPAMSPGRVPPVFTSRGFIPFAGGVVARPASRAEGEGGS